MNGGYQGPGRYRHYKGGEYEVLGLALREGTKPVEEGSWAGVVSDVVYRPLTPGSILEQRLEEFWTRKLSDFNQKILVDLRLSDKPCTDMEGEAVFRFQKIRAITALYFGPTSRNSGHRWEMGTAPRINQRKLYEWLDSDKFPWSSIVDGKLYDKNDETQSQCVMHYKDGWTAIAFAHRLHDPRGGCNGNFFFDTTLTFEQCVEEARRQFPALMAKLDAEAPLFLRQDGRGQVPA